MTANATEAPVTTSTDEAAKPAKPAVFDSRGASPERGSATPIELGMRVKVLTDKDKDEAGKPLEGTVTGIEYQRQRVVIKLDTQEKLVVRPAAKVFVIKNSSGKIERVERAVRAGRKAKDAEAPAPVAEDAAAE